LMPSRLAISLVETPSAAITFNNSAHSNALRTPRSPPVRRR
jgi:hypothetical protein